MSLHREAEGGGDRIHPGRAHSCEAPPPGAASPPGTLGSLPSCPPLSVGALSNCTKVAVVPVLPPQQVGSLLPVLSPPRLCSLPDNLPSPVSRVAQLCVCAFGVGGFRLGGLVGVGKG